VCKSLVPKSTVKIPAARCKQLAIKHLDALQHRSSQAWASD
jgi:hypothetical protein